MRDIDDDYVDAFEVAGQPVMVFKHQPDEQYSISVFGIIVATVANEPSRAFVKHMLQYLCNTNTFCKCRELSTLETSKIIPTLYDWATTTQITKQDFIDLHKYYLNRLSNERDTHFLPRD